MEAMSPGSMAGCRPVGQEEANSAQAYGYFSSENPDLAEVSYHKSKAYQFSRRPFPLIPTTQTSVSGCLRPVTFK